MSLLQDIFTIYTNEGKTRASPREIINSIESETKVEFIGRGANRAVFKHAGHVYKVPISSTGQRQNTDSYETYNKLESRGEEDVVASVRSIHNGIIKQDYCPTTDDPKDREEVEDKLEEYGYEYLDWDDSSVGDDGGVAVLVDIGGLKV